MGEIKTRKKQSVNSKLEIITKIVDNIFPPSRKGNSVLSLVELEQTLTEWTYENLIRLEFFMRRKTKFGKYIAEEGIEAINAFEMLIEDGGNPVFDENDKADDELEPIENNHENQEGLFLSIVVYNKDDSFITGEVKARKIYEINQSIASKFKVDDFVIPYPLLCFEKWSINNFHNSGIYNFNPLAFYQDLNDETDGTNLRRGNNREYYMLAWDTDKVYSIIKQINSILPNLNYSENEKTKIKILEERLSKFYEGNTIVIFGFYFDA